MIALFILTGLLLAAADAPQGDDALAAEVARLVRQLDASSVGERDEAERKLLALGAGALAHLPVIGERAPAETAVRVTRVQQKLLAAQGNAAAEATTVTLKGDDLPVSEVLAAIGKQTGNPIVDHREAFGEEQKETRIKVDFEKTPFWQAMDKVLDEAGLTLYSFAGGRGAFVINRSPGAMPRSGHADYAGLFRLDPLRFEAVQDLRNERMQSLKFYLEATWEPRLQPIAIMQPLSEVTAVGDGGEAISVANSNAEPEATVREGMSAVELEIPLALPPRKTTKIRSLKGKLLALVPGPMEEFHFRNLPIATANAPASRVEQKKASATVTVDQVRKNNDAWELSLRVKYEGPSAALESHRGWILDNEAYFLDAKGQRVEPGGIVQSRQTKNEFGVDYLFVLEESPQKLDFVYRTPITILELPVAYEFHDLRLP